MNADEIRGRIDRALPHTVGCVAHRQARGGPCICSHDRMLERLLPVVLDVVAEELAPVVEMLDRLAVNTDDDPCRWDHHGQCQEHGWLGPEPGCGDRDAHALLVRLGRREARR